MIFRFLLLSSILTITIIGCESEKIADVELFNTDEVSYAVASTDKLWGATTREQKKTVKLNVLIRGGSSENQRLVQENARTWSQYANVDFNFSINRSSWIDFDINIIIHETSGVDDQAGHSYVGTDSKAKASNYQASMQLWLPSTMKPENKNRVILHEFGHALGLQHEHQHPERTFTYDQNATLIECKKLGWSKEQCYSFKLDTLEGDNYTFFSYDSESIMHYQIHQSKLQNKVNGSSIGGATNLSVKDKIAIASLYPGRISTEEILVDEEQKSIEKQRKIDDMMAKLELGKCEIILLGSIENRSYLYKEIGKSLSQGYNSNDIYSQNELFERMSNDSHCI